MKKIFTVLLLYLVFIVNASFAIDWKEITTPLGKTAYLDADSITEYENYYFYNIKIFNEYINDYSIITIQSSKNRPFSARINAYKLDEYDSLQGDYKNITAKMTKNLEPVTFESTVNSCYKKVKEILTKNNTTISF